MSDTPSPLACPAVAIPPQATKSNYPDVFKPRVEGRIKRRLGDHFGLSNFGVNLTELAPGAQSALLHRHSKQDEFVYILQGTATLATEDARVILTPGMCAGFPAKGVAHHLINESEEPVLYLEIGDRRPGDSAEYPTDDLVATQVDGAWQFATKDGTPYDT